jgi:hypothetical protein
MTATWFPWRWRVFVFVAFVAMEWIGPCLYYGRAA